MSRFQPASSELTALLLAAQSEGEDEDTSRLVLADWLEERGDPRGEMVRLSTAQAHLHPGYAEWHELRDRLESWQEQHLSEWLGRTPHIEVSLQRGLLSLRLKKARTFKPLNPRKVRAVIEEGWADELAVEMIDDAWLERTHRLGQLGHVSGFRFRNGRLTDAGLARLAEIKPRLCNLDLSHNSVLSEKGLEILTNLPELRSLQLPRVLSLTDSGLNQVLRLRRLEQLAFFPENIGERHWRRLAELPRLHRLRLSLEMVAPDAGNQLRDLTHLRQLRHLSLSCASRGAESEVGSLAELSELRVLELNFLTDLLDAGLASLAGMTHLERLRFNACIMLTDAGLAVLSHLKRLRSLEIRRCPRLQGKFLDDLTRLPHLTHLNPGRSSLQAPGALEALCRLTQLRELVLSGHGGLPPADLTRLRQALPECRITTPLE